MGKNPQVLAYWIDHIRALNGAYSLTLVRRMKDIMCDRTRKSKSGWSVGTKKRHTRRCAEVISQFSYQFGSVGERRRG